MDGSTFVPCGGVMSPRRLLSRLAHCWQMVKCAQWADTCDLCAEWKAQRKANAAARVERLTRPR